MGPLTWLLAWQQFLQLLYNAGGKRTNNPISKTASLTEIKTYGFKETALTKQLKNEIPKIVESKTII